MIPMADVIGTSEAKANLGNLGKGAHAVGRSPSAHTPRRRRAGCRRAARSGSAGVRSLADLDLLHRDPFDATLIPQARTDGLVLVTADRMPLGL